ncbi:MAG: carboxypeptidase-like regulatory domain-containing protein [Calditrichaeota bacterium]|nr:carboxypeptidase-like regulatory domain-containing protein [Calditrichota bacterium]
MRWTGMTMILLIFAGCIATQSGMRREKRRPFNPADYKFLQLTGTSEIEGQIVLPKPNGGKEFGVGCEVTLNPATSYSEEFYVKTVQNGIPIEEPDLRALKYIRKTVTDDSGKFVFKRLGEGKYYLYAPVKIEIPRGNGKTRKISTYVHQTIYLHTDEKLKVVLTK